MDEQQEELLRQQKLEAEREKLTEQQRKDHDSFCENLKSNETYTTEHAIKAAKIIRTEHGRHLSSELSNLNNKAEQQAIVEQGKAAAKADELKAQQAQPTAELASAQPSQAIGTSEHGAQQELLARDRNHTDTKRYAELEALSAAQHPQETWQPAAIEVCGPTHRRGQDEASPSSGPSQSSGPSPSGPAEPSHSPTPVSSALNSKAGVALTANEILGRFGNPNLEARHQAQEQQRQQREQRSKGDSATPESARAAKPGGVSADAREQSKDKTEKDKKLLIALQRFTREGDERSKDRDKDSGHERGGRGGKPR